VDAAMVLALEPGVGGEVQLLQCQRLDLVEHGQQTPLNLGPEDLLLGVLIVMNSSS
jgi:hypothetical protein